MLVSAGFSYNARCTLQRFPTEGKLCADSVFVSQVKFVS